MGDDLTLDERECARTPMQWTSDRHGGFSTAARTVRPCIDDETYGFRHVNVADQRRDPASLLNWLERLIRRRKECPELAWGDFTILRVSAPEVLAIRYDFRGTSMRTLHNFSDRRQTVAIDPKARGGNLLVDVFDDRHSRAEDGTHAITLDAYGHRWYRIGSGDDTLNRRAF